MYNYRMLKFQHDPVTLEGGQTGELAITMEMLEYSYLMV